MKTLRTQKVDELIREELSSLIRRELEIPPTVMVTMTRVDVAPDLSHADVYFTVLPDNKRGTALTYLKQNATLLRTALAKTIKIRNTPRLHFILDEKEIYSQEINSIIAKVSKED